MQSLSAQLSMLYKEREQLEEVLGVSSADDVISLVLCSARDQSLSDQLSMLYSEREQLEEVLGVSSAEDIIALVKSFENQLATFYSGGNRPSNEDPLHKDQAHEAPSYEGPVDMQAPVVELIRLRNQNEAAHLALLNKLLG
ncbi:MAG: hypothetical protein FKY71_15770 [Spiribacter salinus]|uniref:Uncharacterized protein n=1 Tax=Spiribacter salinus TaxID=1335746 RepID=A0A540VMU7_9GAMM|nr:MAG: hypothetical protein FKY71_15770 [Spiribacter salinus]